MSERSPFGSGSYPYAIGRVRARESSLLDRSQWNRLLEADEDGALQALREFGYGAAEGQGNAGLSADELIAAEQRKTAEFLTEVTPDAELTDLLFLQADAHNLKALLKARLLERMDAADEFLRADGTIPVAVLRACVSYEDLSPLPSVMAEELDGIFEETSPRLLSARVDRAVFAQAAAVLRGKKCAVLSRYFMVWIRYLNLLAMQRGLRLGWAEQETARMQMADIDAPEAPVTPLPPIQAGETLRETERNMNRTLLSLMREAGTDAEGIAPIACYLLNKQNEARNLRVLFAAKRAGIPVAAGELDW